MTNYELNIGYFYPELLNLYGDRGNIQVLTRRCYWRGINARVQEYSPAAALPQESGSKYPDIIFMGGGPDSSQSVVAKDLQQRAGWLKEYGRAGGVGLYICGAYQLMGHYYQDSNGLRLPGVGLFDLYTRHFGQDKPRCIGNIRLESNLEYIPSTTTKVLVGFENHGGRTYLGPSAQPLGKVSSGFGNNGEDKTEGVIFLNSFGTYLHGPLLPKNPHFADLLIWRALKRKYPGEYLFLTALDDTLEWQAHAAALKLR
ncbi:MAG: hypothetical protein AAB486_03765 [Patescibacteria group bacterium]